MAALTSRALRVKAESRLLRAQSKEVRRTVHETYRAHHRVSHEIAEQLERRTLALAGLGTWPYWAPATTELFSVLVVAQPAYA